MAHAGVIAVCKSVANTSKEECLSTVQFLNARVQFNNVAEVLCVTHVLLNVYGYATKSIGNACETIKVDLCIVGNMYAAQFIYSLYHAICAVIVVDGVNLHVRTLPQDTGISWNREHSHTLMDRVNTRQNNGIRTIFSLARSTVGS